MIYPVDTALEEVDFIPQEYLKNLQNLKLFSLKSLLMHFPYRYEDRTDFAPFPEEESPVPILFQGMVLNIQNAHLYSGKRCLEVVFLDDQAKLHPKRLILRWYNPFFIQKQISTGMPLVIYGRPRQYGKRLVVDQPEFESLVETADQNETPLHFRRIVPIHPAGQSLTPRQIREWVFLALHAVDFRTFPSLLPQGLSSLSVEKAYHRIHFPEEMSFAEQARQRLAFEELFGIQLVLSKRKKSFQTDSGIAKKSKGNLWKKLEKCLPFSLTQAQKRVIQEIAPDLQASKRMNRLLQGDVGSGKTMVALAASLYTLEAGFDVAIMVPTQVLAEQHYLNFQKYLQSLNICIELVTSSKSELSSSLGPKICIGTHALLYDRVHFQKLGLVIIDEQHKFGVLQRTKLVEHPDQPDILVMTATPIPRTLAQMFYGDLDLSLLDELPANRSKIITGIRSPQKIQEAAAFMCSQLQQGRQVYIIYPLIEESEKGTARQSVKAATKEFSKWQDLLAPYTCALLHGRMKNEEKSSVMADFQSGVTQVLISTTVIEVGIDVPNATIMLIENAEYFGLAQLHQLRGRIGRGQHKSYCILMPGKEDLEVFKRLEILVDTQSGFTLAEKDLALRGPGNLLGTQQTGLPPFKLTQFPEDTALVAQAQAAARNLLDLDPNLLDPAHQLQAAFVQEAEALCPVG